MQTLLIGLDAACLPVMERLVDADVVPTIGSLLERGYTDGLVSQLPPWTPSAWPTLYTGVNPGKHGVYGFLTYEGYDWRVVDRTDIQAFALWELLDLHGRSSVVVNVPVTHPPREIDGAVVPGYTAPEDPDCVPADALSTALPGEDYRLYPPKGDETTREDQLAAFMRLARSRGQLFRRLADRIEPSFGFLQFQATDTVFHERPGDWDAVEQVYAAVDDAISTVLDEVEPRNVVIVSDHGMGEYDGYEFRVNEFLRQEGYVETVKGGEGMPSWDSIARNRLRNGEDGDGTERGVLERATALAARTGLTSQRVQRALEPIGLADAVADLVPTDAIRAATEQVDFAASTAYMRSRIELGIRLNVEGREPSGVVSPTDYERVRSDLIHALEEVRTPDGRPVFDAVHPREGVYQGPHVEAAPDIVLEPAGFDQFLSGALRGSQFGPPSEPWNHKRTGLFVAAGPDVDTAGTIDGKRPHLLDVAPTVLATLGVSPSERMDGRVLPLVESPDRQSYPEFNARDTRQHDGDRVEQHLADLGYLEDV